MTAFARATSSVDQETLAWEIKSVNGKGLDIRLRLPPGFDAEDGAFRNRIGAVVTRGNLQASLTIQRAATPPQVRVDGALLRALAAAVADAIPPNAVMAPVSVDSLLAIRGVVEIAERPDSPEDQAARVARATALLETALRDLAASRQAEGRSLGDVLAEHLAAIGALTEAAERAPGRTPAAIMARLSRAIETLAGTAAALDPNRLHQEAILLATRADIREELDRLVIHRRSAEELIGGGGAVGRRLDFLAQELAREANTLCAKSGDAELTAIGLDLRNRIEQFREQVQNLE